MFRAVAVSTWFTPRPVVVGAGEPKQARANPSPAAWHVLQDCSKAMRPSAGSGPVAGVSGRGGPLTESEQAASAASAAMEATAIWRMGLPSVERTVGAQRHGCTRGDEQSGSLLALPC